MIHFSLESTAGGIELEIGGETAAPDFTLQGSFYLDACETGPSSGAPLCDLTLVSLTLETDSSMRFWTTTVAESKVFLAQSVTTRVDLATGKFAFAAPDSFVVGVSWEEEGSPSNTEKGSNLANGTDAITGTLDLGSKPTITFNGMLSATGGALELTDVEAVIDNQSPNADASNTDRVTSCIPSVEDSTQTWVELDATASTDIDQNIAAYVWYVGGEIVGEDEITEALLGPGVHDVQLLVYDEFAAWSSRHFTLEIEDPAGACG